MSAAVDRDADARRSPAASETGTITSMLAWVPSESDTAPIIGRSRATPGMAKADRREGGGAGLGWRHQ